MSTLIACAERLTNLSACLLFTLGAARATSCAFHLTKMTLGAKMFSSVRARLTLWYPGVLALVLISFALAGYFFLSFTLNRRTDDALGEVANAFAATLANDEADGHAGEANAANARGEDAKSSPDEAVKEAVSQNQFRDYQIVMYADARREVAT